jgi:hypothetical protein
MRESLRIGILGPAERGAVWEQRLRPHASVREVILSDDLPAIGAVDACIVLEENENRLDVAQHVVRSGIHTFVVGRLPTDRSLAERLYRASEESGTVLQFSNWAYFNPTTQFMMANLRRPDMLHFQREYTFNTYRDIRASYATFWQEDLSLILKWMDSQVFKIHVNRIPFGDNETLSMQVFMKFDNGSTASLYCGMTHQDNRHVRFASDHQLAAECDVGAKTVRLIQHHGLKSPIVDNRSFDKEEPAKLAVTQFLKAVQMRAPAPYSGYDLLRFTNVMESLQRGTFEA